MSCCRRKVIGVIMAAAVLGAGLTVQAAQVTGLTLSPPKAVVKIGGSVKFKALASFEDGSRKDVTKEADWAPDSSFTGKQEGIFYVAASYQGQKAVATVTVESKPKPQAESPAPGGSTQPQAEKTAKPPPPPPPPPAMGSDFGKQFGDREQQRREQRSRREETDSSGSFYGTGQGKGRTTMEDLRRSTGGDDFQKGPGSYPPGTNSSMGRGQDPRLPGPPMQSGSADESLRYYVVKKTAAGTWRWPNYQCTLTTYEVLSAGEKEFSTLYSETQRRFDLDNQYCREKGCDASGPGAGASRDWKPQKWNVSYQGPLDQYPQALPTDQRSCTGEMR
jgi:hypothetical protein